MRKEIFPELSRLFGKEIAGNLCKLGKQAQELDSYFYQKILLIHNAKEDCSKVEWDLNPFLPLDRVELYYAVKQWLRMQKVILPSSFMDIIIEFVVKIKLKRTSYIEKLLKLIPDGLF